LSQLTKRRSQTWYPFDHNLFRTIAKEIDTFYACQTR
jgi:hypothetical protein